MVTNDGGVKSVEPVVTALEPTFVSERATSFTTPLSSKETYTLPLPKPLNFVLSE